ncbi:MAG: ASCH domain-containing protein [Anaerolineae bacterium]|nr:ASCH domain-containing protein [Anaerolineae bacterium]
MAAITIHQPWATLIAVERKTYETRSWSTNHRGLIAIHAGKNGEELADIQEDIEDVVSWDKARLARWYRDTGRGRYMLHLRQVFAGSRYDKMSAFPLGAVVCIARLVNCHRVEALKNLSAQELAFGNFSPGRFAWEMEVVRYFADPIPAQGAQGVWRWTLPPALAEELAR